jgi:glutamate racemase
MNNTQQPIGVFDSGIGGLSVVRSLMERLPYESIVYFGDTARVPYGTKSVATIEIFTRQIVSFLLTHQVKALVIACNTISAVAQHVVWQLALNIPVFDVISAGADAAVQITRTRCIGVIATSATINSNAYARAIHAQEPRARIVSQACPLFVPLVEEGYLEHPATYLIAEEYLKSIKSEQIDTLVLGCTHYPLLKPLLARVLDDQNIILVDSAVTTAEQVAQYFDNHELHSRQDSIPKYHFFVSDIPVKFQKIGEQFLGRSMDHISHVSLER